MIHFRRDIAYCTGGVDSRRVNAALQITSPGFEVWGPPIAIDEASRQKARSCHYVSASGQCELVLA